jgi:hypothetical protein
MVYRAIALLVLAGAWNAQAGVLGCGGVGSDERREQSARAAGSNLSLEFFVERSGAYVADVDVAVKPARGDAVTLVTDGPICYLALPPGRYTVEATYHGATRTAAAMIPAAAHKPVRVAIAFPASVEKDENIRATPEEKEQARKP